jgi:hypothetical protein
MQQNTNTAFQILKTKDMKKILNLNNLNLNNNLNNCREGKSIV